MDWIAALEREGHALSVAARHDADASVPACPGWTVDDLLAHVGRIHHRTAGIVRTRRQERPTEADGSQPVAPSTNVLAWYEAGLADLLDALRTADPETSVWTFVGPRPVRWWMRRMAQETMVHRVDA